MDAGEAPPASPVPNVSLVYKRHKPVICSPRRAEAALSTDDNDFPRKGEDEDNSVADSWLTRKRK